MAWPVHAGKMAALSRKSCPLCDRMIRGSNLERHVRACARAHGTTEEAAWAAHSARVEAEWAAERAADS